MDHKKKITILEKYISELEQNYQSRFCAMKTQAREEVKSEEEKKYIRNRQKNLARIHKKS